MSRPEPALLEPECYSLARSMIFAIADDRSTPLDNDYKLALLDEWDLKA